MKKQLEKLSLFHQEFVGASLKDFTAVLIDRLLQQNRFLVLPTTMNEIYLAHHSPKIAAAMSTFTYLTPDGMPLVWLLRKRSTHSGSEDNQHFERIYGPDLMKEVCRQSQHTPIRHFFYGGTTKSVKKMISNIADEFPGLKVCGYYAPPFRELYPDERKEIQEVIKKSRPDLIWVGLGSDKQILMIDQWKKELPHCSFIAVGAAFDYLSGRKHQAPEWMRKNGLEWLFRWLSEPSRLFERYILHFPEIVGLFLSEYFRVSDRISVNK